MNKRDSGRPFCKASPEPACARAPTNCGLSATAFDVTLRWSPDHTYAQVFTSSSGTARHSRSGSSYFESSCGELGEARVGESKEPAGADIKNQEIAEILGQANRFRTLEAHSRYPSDTRTDDTVGSERAHTPVPSGTFPHTILMLISMRECVGPLLSSKQISGSPSAAGILPSHPASSSSSSITTTTTTTLLTPHSPPPSLVPPTAVVGLSLAPAVPQTSTSYSSLSCSIRMRGNKADPFICTLSLFVYLAYVYPPIQTQPCSKLESAQKLPSNHLDPPFPPPLPPKDTYTAAITITPVLNNS
ncbi:hypothetical protein C0Q70_03881 [Pomacea canaliculata]|uniref:Uncharacterized protein n=1 Tax=Pomacea canaliculata TaxID=400727 RepID=A0A2T7PTY4_POMCA|nr:hypothetical protein C0Q70_03881 [Pomacea canaliculata]